MIQHNFEFTDDMYAESDEGIRDDNPEYSVPDETPIKIYRYGRYNEITVENYSDCVIVNYIPTGWHYRFNNKNAGFLFAKLRADRLGIIG